MMLISERADIEKKYVKVSKHWSKKWNDLIDKGRYKYYISMKSMGGEKNKTNN